MPELATSDCLSEPDARAARAAAKRDVYARWLEWQRNRAQYSTASAFALAMLDLHNCLAATYTVTRWCTAWGKDTGIPADE